MKTVVNHFKVSNNCQTEKEYVLLCSIFIRYCCLLANNNSIDDDHKELLTKLLQKCHTIDKQYKEKLKNHNSNFQVQCSYVEYLKSSMLFANQLKSLINIESNIFETSFKRILDVYLHNNKVLDIILYPFAEKQEYNDEIVRNYLIKSLTYAINSLNINEFKCVLNILDKRLANISLSSSLDLTFLKLIKILRNLSCEFELKNELREEFSYFIQKVIKNLIICIFKIHLFIFYTI